MNEIKDLDLKYKKKLIRIHYLNDLDLTEVEYFEIKKHVLTIFKELGPLSIVDRKTLLEKYMCLTSIFLVWFFKSESNGSSFWEAIHKFSDSGVPLPTLKNLLAALFKKTVRYFNLIDFNDASTHNIHLLPIQAHAFLPSCKKEILDSIFSQIYIEYSKNKDSNIIQNRLRSLIFLIKKQQLIENKNNIAETNFDEIKFISSQKELFNSKPFKDEFIELLALDKGSPESLKTKIEKLRSYKNKISKKPNVKLIINDQIWSNIVEKGYDTNAPIENGTIDLFIKTARFQEQMCKIFQDRQKIIPVLEIELIKLEAQYSGMMTKLVEYYGGQDFDKELGCYSVFVEDKNRYNEITKNLYSHEYLNDTHATIAEIHAALDKAEENLKGINYLFNNEMEGNSSFLQLLPKAMKQVCILYPKIAENQLVKEFNKFVITRNKNSINSDKTKTDQRKKKAINRPNHNNLHPTIMFDPIDNIFKINIKDFYFFNKNTNVTSLKVKITINDVFKEQLERAVHEENGCYYIESFIYKIEQVPKDFIVEFLDPSEKNSLKSFFWYNKRQDILIFNPDTGEELGPINGVDRINAIIQISVNTNGKILYRHPLSNYWEFEHRVIDFEGCAEIILQKEQQVIYKIPLPVSHLRYELDLKGRIHELLFYKMSDESRNLIPVYFDIPNLYIFNNNGLPFILECKRVESHTSEFICTKTEAPIHFDDNNCDYHKITFGDGEIKPGNYIYTLINKSTRAILAEFFFLYLPGLLCNWSRSLQYPSSSNAFNIINKNEYKIIFNQEIYNKTHNMIQITAIEPSKNLLTIDHKKFTNPKFLKFQLPVIRWSFSCLKTNPLNNKFWIEDILIDGNYLEIEKLYSGYEYESLLLVVNGKEKIPLKFLNGVERINFYDFFNTIQSSHDNNELDFSIAYQSEVLHLFSIMTKWIVFDVCFYTKDVSSSGVYVTWREKVSPKSKRIRVWKKDLNNSYTYIKEELINFDSHDAYISIDGNQNSFGTYSFEFTCESNNVWGVPLVQPDSAIYDYIFGAREAYLDRIMLDGIEIKKVTKGLRNYEVRTKLIIKDINKAPKGENFFEEEDQLLMGKAFYKKKGLHYLENSSPVYFYINHEKNTIPFIQDRDRDGAQFDIKLGEIYWEMRDYDNDSNRVIAPLDRFHIKKLRGKS